MNLQVIKQLSKTYQLSNYIKNERPYFVITLLLSDEEGNQFHHNVHYEERIGGVNKHQMNQLDSILRDLIDDEMIGKKTIIIENVVPYTFTCSMARRSWIQPSKETKIKIKSLYSEKVIDLNNQSFSLAV